MYSQNNTTKFVEGNFNIREFYIIGLTNNLQQEGIKVSIELLSELIGEEKEYTTNRLKKFVDKGFLIKYSNNELMMDLQRIFLFIINDNELLQKGTTILADCQNLYLTRTVPELVGANDFGMVYYTYLLDLLRVQYETNNSKIGTVTITTKKKVKLEVVDYE